MKMVLKGLCGVCLRAHVLHKGMPKRHGFQVDTRFCSFGLVGAVHGDACEGVRFPHLGESTEGTVWYLGKLKNWKANLEAALANLETKPRLTWTKVNGIYNRKTYRTEYQEFATHLLNVGDETYKVYPSNEKTYEYYEVPAYETVYEKQRGELLQSIAMAKEEIERYEDIIKNWEPHDPVEEPAAAAKPPTYHYTFKNRRGKDVIQCGRTGYSVHTTKDPKQVTCQRCKKALAPTKPKKRTYTVTLPDGVVKKESFGGKRQPIAYLAYQHSNGNWSGDWAVSEANLKNKKKHATTYYSPVEMKVLDVEEITK